MLVNKILRRLGAKFALIVPIESAFIRLAILTS